MSTTQRLLRLEALWGQRTVTTPNDADLDHLRWWSRPVFPGVLRDFCSVRAQARLTAEGGLAWYGGISDDERRQRTLAEYDELDRLQIVYGDEGGWETWHAQAAEWSHPHGPIDAAMLARRLEHAFTVADTNRADHARPLWRRVWPEWQAGMSLSDHLAFDFLLATEGGQRVERASAQTPGA